MFVLGAVFGSFLTCQAWRLRYRDLGKKPLGRRSVCLSCHYQLKWFDNLPLISWLVYHGRCRRCHAKIGVSEFLAEISLALVFLALAFTFDPFTAQTSDWLRLLLQMLLTLSLSFLAIYDAKWGELPVPALIVAGFCASIFFVFTHLDFFTNFNWSTLFNLLGALAILGGLYYLLYLFSHGRWVGNGDYLLGAILALVLAEAWLALITLFLANLLGTVMFYVFLRRPASTTTHSHQHRSARRAHPAKIPLGPFLIIASFIASYFADFFRALLGV